MTMKEFKEYLDRDIKYYEEKVNHTLIKSIRNKANAVLKELKDIRKVINL